MSYATLDDLLAYASRSELTELTTDDAGTEPDEAMISQLLSDSSAEIDSHCPAGVSIAEGSRSAARVACFLTLYHLYSRRASFTPTEGRQNQFAQARYWLFELAHGGLKL